MNILLVEDEKNLRESIAEFLKNEGYHIESVASYKQALQKDPNLHDLIILDWNLTDGQGIDLLKLWRKTSKIKVLLLTARADIVDRVLGLELGAQDYLTKPFDPRELLARIRVQLRAEITEKVKTLAFGHLKIQEDLREVFFKETKVTLTKMEYDLLLFLVTNPNKPFSRDELLNAVWGMENFPSTRTVDNHILQLRNKLHPEYFETIHGIGYRFKK